MKNIIVKDFTFDALETFRTSVGYNSDDYLYITINSMGGEVYALLGMLDIIENQSKEVITCCSGTASSCGFVLFSAGKYRFIGQNSHLMLHEVCQPIPGNGYKMTDNFSTLKQAKKLNDQIIKILARNLNKEHADIKKLMNLEEGGDVFFNATEALEHGIATKIGFPQFAEKKLIT